MFVINRRFVQKISPVVWGLFGFLSTVSCAQTSNWRVADTTLYNFNDTAKVWRTGGVAISPWLRNPFGSKLLVTNAYVNKGSRAAYFAINEPNWFDKDSTKVGLANDSLSSYSGLVANHFANFKQGVFFKDVHHSAFETNFFRGIADTLGFRDGGRLRNAYTARLGATFANNGRPHKTDEFDILNLRLFTGNSAGNLAEITHFYGIRLDYIRGVNLDIIKNGWGVYIVPTTLKNYFAGHVGIGTNTVTNALTVQATADPVKLMGIQEATDHQLLTIDASGVLHKRTADSQTFLVTHGSVSLSDEYQLYIHKGGNATYTLPAAAARAGRSWKIVNIGTGMLTLSQPYYEGNALRTDILNVAGGYTREIFSDGAVYVAIK